MTPSRSLSRRSFLARTGAALGVPLVVTSPILGGGTRPAPSERITVGVIGAGKRAGTLMGGLSRFEQAQIVAVAEVESERRAHRAKMAEDRYGKGCAQYNDFRKLIAREDIDAVIIATPDHWHAIPALAAAKAKKDIYCEKPLTLTIEEARVLALAPRKYGVVFQTGSQQRAECGGRFHRACELVRNGRIGKIREVYVNVGGPSTVCNLPEQPVPEGTDWNLWLGPAPWRGYHEQLCPKGVHNHYPAWRNYRDYSGGGMTDWGAHHFDIAQWGLGRDGSGPVEIIPPDGKDHPHLTYVYEDGVRVYHAGRYKDESVNGLRFIGSDGMIEVNRSHFRTWPERVGKEEIGEGDVRLYKANNQIGNWLECIKSREDPICTAAIGAGSVTVCHLGNLAYWNKRKLRWDPKKWEFPGDAEANGWRDRPRRDPWKLLA